jgi:thiol-disulfide isomerase/thioredoxin
MKKYLAYVLTAIVLVALFVAAGIYLDRSNVTMPMPSAHSYGAAPDFTGITNWINSAGLTTASLRGKVVLVDFWTYSCINCLRTLPYVTGWYSKYKDAGLVVVGVHTPEFSFEQVPANVEAAVVRLGITYPVAQDNGYKTWNAYGNRYWPAEYLIDQNGNIVYESFGEGDYVKTENAIRSLLKMGQVSGSAAPDLSGIGSPEMYFGTARQKNLAPAQDVSTTPAAYTLPVRLDLNEFALGGTWHFSADSATLDAAPGAVELHFHSAKLYVVASSPTPVTLKILVDGVAQPDVVVSASQLYTLFDSSSYADHTAVITVSGAGFQAFTFTFG